VHTFSVVIATRNRQALLADALDAIAAQEWPAAAVEVIVADNGSTDRTSAVVADFSRRPGVPFVRYLFVAEPGKSTAVNRALALASGDLVALTDDDVRPEPSWLRALAAAFDETGADFVAGRIHPAWESPPPAWLSPSLYGVLAVPDNGSERIAITPDHHQVVPIGANMAVRRAVVRRLGGLRVDLGKLEGTLRTGEDHEFFLRMLHAGCRGVYEPAAVVHHRVGAERLHRRYFRQWLHQNGRDVARLEADYPPVPCRRLLRAPGYLWRRAAGDAAGVVKAAARRDPAGQFGSSARLVWFAGYLRETWFGNRGAAGASRKRSSAPPLAPQAG
jgi:glycosyltransferase involved in cell wall biosynthesis